LHSTTDSDVPALDAAGLQDYLPTSGKTSPQAPSVQIVAGLAYQYGPFSASGRLKYVGSQYATLMDDQKMPGFLTNDFSLSFKFGNFGYLHDPKIQLNLSNIANSRYRSGVQLYYFNARTRSAPARHHCRGRGTDLLCGAEFCRRPDTVGGNLLRLRGSPVKNLISINRSGHR